MRLKGSSCIYFEYEVDLLNYTIKKAKNLNWAFEVLRFLKPNSTALVLGAQG